MSKNKKQTTRPVAPPVVPVAPPAGPTGGWKVAAAIAIAACLLYLGTVAHSFTLDDVHVVRDHPALVERDWAAAAGSSYWPEYLHTGASNWRPLASLSWLLDRLGLDHAGPATPARHAAWAARHHAVNALLHGLAVLLCFPFARRMLGSVRGAWIACALFAVHPAHTEVVAPIVGRTDLLAGIGVLGMCAAFWRYRDGGGGGWLALSVAAFAVGLGGKESAAPVVLVLPLADVWLRRQPWRTLWSRDALAYLPFAIVLLLYLGARTAVLGAHSLAHSQAAALGPWERVAFTGHNSWLSGWLLVFPVRFHHVITTVPSDAPFTYPTPAGVWLAIWPVILLPLWAGWIPLITRAPFGALIWIGVLLPWLPTSGVLPAAAGLSLRFLFISTAFAAVGAVAAGRWWMRRREHSHAAVLGLAAVWLVAGLVITVRRIPAWRNDGTFHTALLAEVERCYTSEYSLGAWKASNGLSLDEARVHFQRAIDIAGPTDRSISARTNLATSYEFGPSGQRYGDDADLDRALAVYAQALALKPDSGTAHINAAIVCDRLAHRAAVPEALRRAYRERSLTYYEGALRLQPGHLDRHAWHRRAAEVSQEMGRPADARRHYRAAAAARAESRALVEQRGGPAGWQETTRAAIEELTRALHTAPDAAEEAEIRAALRAWQAR